MLKYNELKKVADLVVADIKKELSLQGHEDTGALAASMMSWAAGVTNEVVIQAYAADYINDLVNGVAPSKIRVSAADFENLKGWVGRKIGATSPGEQASIASAIVRNWKKYGKPSVNSKAYSSTGEVMDAIGIAYEKNEEKYTNFLDDSICESIDKEFLLIKSGTI